MIYYYFYYLLIIDYNEAFVLSRLSDKGIQIRFCTNETVMTLKEITCILNS